jgi:hypothetical protein
VGTIRVNLKLIFKNLKLKFKSGQGGIQHASQTKIYNLETDEFVSNPPFLKTNLAGVISYPTFWWE